ncbi:MAG: amidase [Acidimicrobiia bacterium]
MSGTEPWNLDLTSAVDLIGKGAFDASDVVESCLRRTAAVEPIVQAFAERDDDRAIARARSLDAVPRDRRGRLHGIPIGIKDVMDAEGFRTRAGSAVLGDAAAADGNAPAVDCLVDAGGVVVGKTTTHEFAYGCETPPTRNPWDPDRIAGGSSGGSAAAVASGECLGALGSDSGGSIRIPAALCGITGLRPLVGSIPLDRTVPFSRTHDTVGPIARTAADVALMWSVLSGEVIAPVADLTETTIAAPGDLASLGTFNSDVLTAYEEAIDVLARHGATRRDAALPKFAEWSASRTAVVLSEFLAAHTHAGWYPSRRERYSAELQRYFARAEEIRGADLVLAHRELDTLAHRFRRGLGDADALILPTVSIDAPYAASIDSSQGVGITENTMRLLQTTAPVSYTGLASLTVPCGMSDNGLPLGVQIIGRTEQAVLSIGLAYQQVTDFHTRRPPIPA